MKKVILLTAIFLTGCGTLKKTNEETEIKKDSSSITTIDISKLTGNFSLKPFDPDKPMIIGKDTIVNTIIENHYTKETIKLKDTTSVKHDLKKEVSIKDKDYTEVIKSIANRFILLIVILFVLFQVLSYLKRKATLL